MVYALFTLIAGLERATRKIKGASTLNLLHVLVAHPGIRPSELAKLQQVHPSLVTRQIQELEEAGFVSVVGNPADQRAAIIEVTPAGADELRRLGEVGLDRFVSFVAEWDRDEVRTFTRLLEKLQTTKAAVSARELELADPRKPHRRSRTASPELRARR
jgi:DNA-binding MarR family transcriptional regulator